MKKNSKILLGIFLMGFPPVGLVFILSAYAILSFVISSLYVASDGESALPMVIGSVLNVGLGFLGIVCVLGFFVAIPVGLALVIWAVTEQNPVPTHPSEPVPPSSTPLPPS